MIIATSLVAGFKQTISEKVFGFWGHVHIKHLDNYEFDVTPTSVNQPFYPDIQKYQMAGYTGRGGFKAKDNIRHIQKVISQEGIIKTSNQIEGILLKGIGEDFDWTFLESNIVQGRKPNLSKDSLTEDILISEITSKRLGLNLGDKVIVNFVKNNEQLKRRFVVCGTYKTGLEEYDKRNAVVDYRHLQSLNNWRPYKQYIELRIHADSIRKDQNWPKLVMDIGIPEDKLWLVRTISQDDSLIQISPLMLAGKSPLAADFSKDGMVVSDRIAERMGLQLGDSLWLRCKEMDDIWRTSFILEGVYRADLLNAPAPMLFTSSQKLNTANQEMGEQVGGFELILENIDDLDAAGSYIYEEVITESQSSQTIKESFAHIFDWLNFQNTNELIIMILMLIVAIVNMMTAVMILIIERTNMIGILKSLGMRASKISQIFIYQAGYIVLYGLLIGNAMGLGLCYLQQWFGIIRLPEDLYYVSVAPVRINYLLVLGINLGAMAIIVSIMVLPALLVRTITPVKALRFK